MLAPRPLPTATADERPEGAESPARLSPAARADALARWDALAWKIARAWGRRNPRVDLDDLYMEARTGFVIAASRFDPTRGARFSTYAVWWARARLARFVRGESARGLHVPDGHGWPRPTVASLDSGGGGGGRLAETVEGRPGADAPAASADWWDRVLCGLRARQRDVLLLRFRDGLTLAAIGQRYGVSRERVRQLAAGALSALRTTRPDLAHEWPS